MGQIDSPFIPVFAQRSNSEVLVHDGLPRRLDYFDLHIELREVSSPADGRTVQLGELEFELWATEGLVVEFQRAEYLRAIALRVLRVCQREVDGKPREIHVP